MTNFSIVLCLIVALLQPLSTSLEPAQSETLSMPDLLQNEILQESLNSAGQTGTVASIVGDTLDLVGTNQAVPDTNKAEKLLKDLQVLVKLVHKYEPLVRPVCQFAFGFMERAVMGFLINNPRGTRAMKQIWPAESAEIEAILTSVKSEMEGVNNKFNEAMLLIQQAVNSQNIQERTQALRRYEVIMSDVQPVFDTCQIFMKKALAILKTLEPKVKNMIEESMEKAVTTSSYTITAACIAAYAFRDRNAWKIALPVAVVTTGVSFGTSFLQRHELRDDLVYYNSEIMLIIKIEIMKKRLKSGRDTLVDLTEKPKS